MATGLNPLNVQITPDGKLAIVNNISVVRRLLAQIDEGAGCWNIGMPRRWIRKPL
jgi:hypothetical protein